MSKAGRDIFLSVLDFSSLRTVTSGKNAKPGPELRVDFIDSEEFIVKIILRS